MAVFSVGCKASCSRAARRERNFNKQHQQVISESCLSVAYMLSKFFLQPTNLLPFPSNNIPSFPLIPPNQPNNPDHSPYLFSRSSNPSSTIPSLASHVNKARALEGVIAKHDAIKREISVLREPVEKTTTMKKSSGDNENGRDGEEEGEEHSGGVSAEVDKDSRHIRTIVPHELEGSKGE